MRAKTAAATVGAASLAVALIGGGVWIGASQPPAGGDQIAAAQTYHWLKFANAPAED